MRRAATAALLLVCAQIAACRDLAEPAPDAPGDSGGGGFPYPPPSADVVAAVGSPATLEIATWNIENFPAGADTPSYVADLITSLDLDVVVVEEIANEAAWRELMDRLREHDGILSTHTYSSNEYQKVGVIYRTSMVTPGAPKLLFTSEGYVFPRPPLSVPIAVDDGTHAPLQLELIGVHLKAGFGVEDGDRRRAAIEQLDAHLRTQVAAGGEDEVIIAGDYNEIVTTATGQANLAAFLDAPERYTIRTRSSALSGEISFVPSNRLLDHITTTAGLADEAANARIVIPKLHTTYSGYVNHISDHLPVVLVIPW